MKKNILLLFFLFSYNIFAQDDKTVTLVVNGHGKTQDEAKQNALRNAIEQAFGTFISSKTEILNDKLIKDEIISVTKGNIQSFKILNESQFPNGNWGITLNTKVSVSMLTSFVESKGITIEIKGGMFAINIKQQKLNEEGEVKAIKEMVSVIHESIQISFDYVIKSGEPKSLDAESKNWEIPLVVTATTNKNIDFCANYCIKTLAALSLSSEEVTSYQSLNKDVFPVVINYGGITNTFYLRKKNSLNALKIIGYNWEFYNRLFEVQSSIDKSQGIGLKSKLNNFLYQNTLTFPIINQEVSIFKWNDLLTFEQIEKMDGYKIIPRGKVSHLEGLNEVYDTTINDIIFKNNDLDEKAGHPYLLDGFNYDLRNTDFSSCSGEINFQFIVNRDGSIQDLKVSTESVNLDCIEVATQFIKNVGYWTPGKKNGKAVRSRISKSIRIHSTNGKMMEKAERKQLIQQKDLHMGKKLNPK